MEKELKNIINYFGIDNQLIKLNEEVGELIIASERNNYFEIQEELADVMVMLKQIQLYFDVDDAEIYDVMKEKVQRTIKRIKNGYYDNHR